MINPAAYVAKELALYSATAKLAPSNSEIDSL